MPISDGAPATKLEEEADFWTLEKTIRPASSLETDVQGERGPLDLRKFDVDSATGEVDFRLDGVKVTVTWRY